MPCMRSICTSKYISCHSFVTNWIQGPEAEARLRQSVNNTLITRSVLDVTLILIMPLLPSKETFQSYAIFYIFKMLERRWWQSSASLKLIMTIRVLLSSANRSFFFLVVLGYYLSRIDFCLLKLMYSYYKILLFAIVPGCGRCDGCET